MDKDITRYLNDHLAGSSAALPLIQELADHHDTPGAPNFFLQLKKAVEADQSALENLLERIGHDPSAIHKIAGGIAARVASIKLMWEQIEPGRLGLLEALEMLALGVEGKLLLWRTLQELAAWFPEWESIDFKELELRAARQRSDIEGWRIQAARDVLAHGERRAGVKMS